MADLITADLLMPSSFATAAICFDISDERRKAMSGYFEAGAFVFALFISIFFLCWLVLHLQCMSLYDVSQPVYANSFA